jgi:hypothetical protein
MEGKISARYDFTGGQVVAALGAPVHESLNGLAVCALVMEDGFVLIDKAAPVPAANFDRELVPLHRG